MNKGNNSSTSLKETLRTALANMAQSWWQHRGFMAHALYPLSCLTRLVIKHKQNPNAKAKAWKAPVPVIVIGNIYVGGTGKTPAVIACAKALCNLGWRPGIVSRGYGVNIGSQPRVSTEFESHPDPVLFGDEPALIAQESGCPIAVHPKRRLAIASLLAIHPEVDVVISDDGLQHVEMGRDVEILVQDDRGVGNGWVLPAGPLREPATRLDKVDAIITRSNSTPFRHAGTRHKTPTILTADTADAAAAAFTAMPSRACSTIKTQPRRIWMNLEPIQFRQVMTGRTLSISAMLGFAQEKTVGAAAGIGVPQRFFNTLQNMGLHLEWMLPLPDHAQLDATTFAKTKSDLIFITAKDAIKCRSLEDERLWALDIKARFTDRDQDGQDGADFFTWLDQRLREAAAEKSKLKDY